MNLALKLRLEKLEFTIKLLLLAQFINQQDHNTKKNLEYQMRVKLIKKFQIWLKKHKKRQLKLKKNHKHLLSQHSLFNTNHLSEVKAYNNDKVFGNK